jgi:TRAP-type uncharacterized transport system substrate-binding protein
LPLVVIVLTALLLPVAAPATNGSEADAAADIVFSAGRKGGGYWGVAERLQGVAEESGLTIEVRESVGSIQNLERLADPGSSVNLTLTQADALRKYMKENPGFASHIEILESIGLECVFIISATEGEIKSDQDLQDPRGYRIAIPGEQSGVAVTFDYMTNLVPGLDNAKPVYTDTQAAMERILARDPSAVDAVMLVHRPKVRSPEIHLALDKPDVFRMVPVEDRHLADKLPSGETVYDFLDVPLIRLGLSTDKSVPTICTRGKLLSSRDKMSPEVAATLKRIIDFQWMRIYPTDI